VFGPCPSPGPFTVRTPLPTDRLATFLHACSISDSPTGCCAIRPLRARGLHAPHRRIQAVAQFHSQSGWHQAGRSIAGNAD